MPIASTENVLNPTDFKTGDLSTPLILDSLEQIVEIGCGSNHSLAINDKGEIFSWGEGLHGQLGHGKLDNEYYPRKIESLKNFRFKYVSGGATHSVAISHDDYLFGWGSNEKYQLNFKNACNQPGNYKDLIASNSSDTKIPSYIPPLILPVFELIGNYTKDEIINLNLDEKFGKSNIRLLDENVIFDKDLQNDYSFNPDDLMKVKLLQCGTWFTVCTSMMFPNSIYIFGNFYKRVIKISFFEDNKLEIKQITASSQNICVFTSENSVYKINVSNLSNTKSELVEKIVFSSKEIEIEKISCGYDYLLILTKNNQAILNKNFEKENFILLNSEVKSDVKDIANGPSHFFLLRENYDLGDYFYSKILNYVNSLNSDGLYADLFIQGNGQKDFAFPCHSLFLQGVFNLDLENNTLNLNLSHNSILYLLELIYTSKIKLLSTDESKLIIENPEILQTMIIYLNEILLSLKDSNCQNEIKYNLVEVINLYIERTKDYISNLKSNKDFERILIFQKYSETGNFITKNIINFNSQSRLETSSATENQDRDDIDMNDDRRDYFQQFSKGTKINVLSNMDYDVESGKNTSNILEYIKIQNEILMNKNLLNKNIQLSRKKLQYSINKLLKTVIPRNLSIKIILEEGSNETIHYKYNKIILTHKSIYFNNLLKSDPNIQEISLKNLNFNFSKNSINNILKFLHSEKFEFNFEEIFEMLEISSFLMIDNFNSLIEIELERIISKFI